MSWNERIQSPITVTTGDGKKYEFIWKGSVQDEEFNISEFNYPNVSGTNVDRGEAKGRRFSFEVWYQGDDHIDRAEEFRRSARIKKSWLVEHPYYDNIRVQPRALRFDNREYNITKITGTLLETNEGKLPAATLNPIDEINAKKVEVDENSVNAYESGVSDIKTDEINQINSDLDSIEKNALEVIEDPESKIEFTNQINDARSAVSNIVTDVRQGIQKVQSAINYPFQVISDVKSSIELVENQWNQLLTTIGALSELTVNNRNYVQAQGSNYISSILEASISFEFDSPDEVENLSTRMIALFNSYVETMDEMQTDLQTEEDSFAGDQDVYNNLQDMVYFTISRLNSIVLDSETEYVIFTESATNILLLTHRVYGLDDQDENIDRLINTNDITLDELIEIPKDREIRYFV